MKIESRRFGSAQAIPAATALMSVAFIWLGLTEYGFWNQAKGPMPGFFPVVVAIAMLAASVLAFAFSFKEEAPEWPRANWLVVLSVALVMGATFVIGLIPAVAAYVLVWLRAYEKCSWRTTLVTFAVIMAIVVGCFVFWLGVPFPKGLVYDTLFNR